MIAALEEHQHLRCRLRTALRCSRIAALEERFFPWNTDWNLFHGVSLRSVALEVGGNRFSLCALLYALCG